MPLRLCTETTAFIVPCYWTWTRGLFKKKGLIQSDAVTYLRLEQLSSAPHLAI